MHRNVIYIYIYIYNIVYKTFKLTILFKADIYVFVLIFNADLINNGYVYANLSAISWKNITRKLL